MYRVHLGLIDPRPISYLGLYPETRLLFSSGLIVSSMLFIMFGYYIKRLFNVKNRFLIYLITGQIAQIVVAIIPDTARTRGKVVHTIAGFTLAFSLPFLIRAFAASQSKSKYHRLYRRLYRLEQGALTVGLAVFIFTKGVAPLGEALPTVGFHVWVLALTFIAFQVDQPARPGI